MSFRKIASIPAAAVFLLFLSLAPTIASAASVTYTVTVTITVTDPCAKSYGYNVSLYKVENNGQPHLIGYTFLTCAGGTVVFTEKAGNYILVPSVPGVTNGIPVALPPNYSATFTTTQ